MASDVVRDLADDIIMGTTTPENGNNQHLSNESFVTPQGPQSQVVSTASYVWATNDSVFSGDVDRWIDGDDVPVHTGIQDSRVETSHRSTLAMSQSMDSTGFWYIAAMVLPLFSLGSNSTWRCTSSMVLNMAELLLTHVAGFCRRARNRIRGLTREQAARDILAGAMDVILVVYAMGFLLLSAYQSSIFRT